MTRTKQAGDQRSGGSSAESACIAGQPSSSRRFLTRKTRPAPRLTAASRTRPSNSGWSSGRDVEDAEVEGDGADDQRTDQRADGTARAAHQRGAADHDGGDRVQRVGAGLGHIGVAGRGLQREVEAADAGEEAGQGEGRELAALDPHARHVGRALGRADGVDAAAGDRVAERHPDQHHDQDGDDQRHRQPGERA